MTTCTKRGYGSEEAAKVANRTAGFRIRAYLCDGQGGCLKWHVANQDKDRLEFKESYGGRKGRRRRHLDLAPERTLDEVQAIAAKMRARHGGAT